MKNSDSIADLSALLDMGREVSPGQESRLDARNVWNLLLRFRWVLIGCFGTAMSIGLFLVIFLPRLYQADATILIEPQSVPDKYVHATVPVDIESRIASLTQQILSRSNLLALIEKFKLFTEGEKAHWFSKFIPSADDRGRFVEDKLELMRKQISVTIEGKRGGSRAGAFKISYKHSDPKKSYQVVNALTTYVIDQNLKMREVSAFGTSDFLQSELTNMRKRLEEVENALEAYRRAHMGELPEQLQSNLTILERMQQQLAQTYQSIRDERNRLIIVESQLKMTQQVAAPSAVATMPGADGTGPKSLDGLKQQLVEYESKYTPNHPDVVILRKKIESLEKDLADNSKPSAEPQPAKAATPVVSRSGKPLMEAELSGQQQAITRNIAALEAETSKIQAQIEQYQKRVENTPKREQELLLLKRDYDNIKTTYSSVLNRKLEADIALNMEKTQKGEQFQILDAPRTSDKPVFPNLKLIFIVSVALGLGAGGGIVFLHQYFDRGVRRPETLQAKLSLPVLMVMPAMERMQSRRSKYLAWLNDGFSAAGVLACLGLLAGLAAFTVFNLSPGDTVQGLFQ